MKTKSKISGYIIRGAAAAILFGSAVLAVVFSLHATNTITVTNPNYDQRGLGFARVVNDRIDIGSFEVSPTSTCVQTMYGANGNGALNRGALIIIDQTNGSGTVVGTPVGGVGLPGIAFHPDGRLFASTVTSGSSSTLIQVNPDTGALIATIGPITDNGTPISISDLSFQPGTGVLYGIRSSRDGLGGGGFLYTINITTAVATFIGDTGACQGGGLGFA